MFLLKSIIFAFIAIVSIEANLIYKVKVNTASCDDCGMSNTFGALRLQICNSQGDCCNTAKLDNPFENDFQEGGSDEFTDSDILNQCYRFDLHSDLSMRMTLRHEGTDGYQADSIEVYTDPNTNYRCLFSTFLDGDVSEVGQCSPF